MWYNTGLKFYVLVPHFVQNFAFGLNDAPHEVHPPDGIFLLGINAGSGDGKVPTSPNACCADTILGGPPTGFCAVPDLGIPIPAIIPGCPIPGINPGD